MKNLLYTCLVLLFLIPIPACDDDFLDKQPSSEYSGNVVWTDLALMQTFVNNVYNNIPHGFTELMMASISDEAILTFDGGSSNVTKSLITPSDYSVFEPNNGWMSGVHARAWKMSWETVYKSIRACNLFLQEVEKNTYDDEELKNRLLGEVYFLRAYHYHNLVFLYGGVPIITTPYGLNDDHLAARNTFEECIKFIVDDCDKAAALLPDSYSGNLKGRATKGAALALKSRVLLFAASNLYHNQNAWSQGYPNPELIGYVGGDRAERWRQAKNAAKAVMDLNVYDLYKKEPAPGDNVAKNYEEIFLSKETNEDIFVRFFIQNSAEGYNPGRYNNPNGYFGYGGNTPTSQLVDAFEMSDGSKFSWDNPVHRADPYKNREPRFYANILFEGAKWQPRQAGAVSLDPVGVIQVGYYEQPDGSWVGGLDTRNSSFAAKEDGTYTGYYLRKFIDPTVNTQFLKQDAPWRFIRYAEVLLNYAEASNELGEDAQALEVINIIRKRAGLPTITGSGNELREKIRQERKIELMYEDQRFFDIRRWMIAPQVLSTNALGVDIRYKLGMEKPTYSFVSVRDRTWKDWSYFMPIKLDEMNRNKLLIQNPLY
ncbi:RagB/SusD family nutrient uptake outer membrane protein [Adhaeribacter arboris]|uniref:RagB/SusD family nutrient uptake outer membrane protein n=1 Tax=Adhaeribacter arboris TaxID=2072846 RepID=A0A2T2YEU1_9BACT|nr:RagB/SusD family nutrient uptake outer membrane protein [Adhaeribacter arboris]PSR54029.1 RagB/SusD family nutrient uptake outer membrane protein [Adhaeribacter arboris]